MAPWRRPSRASGRAPELWRADDGSMVRSSFEIKEERTDVPIALAAHDAVFLVLRTPTKETAYRAPTSGLKQFALLDGGWELGFPPESGAPEALPLPSLSSWTDSKDPAIRYFSGTARYRRTVAIPRTPPGTRVLLDLGAVANVARVTVNGRLAGHAWKSPYRVDLSDFVRPGRNRIEIEVANLWPNRMIGDHQPGAGPRRAEAAFDPFKPDSPLLPSGLLGPVRLLLATPASEAGGPAS